MSGGEVRKVSRQDIQLVQNLIERCLQLYMSQKEVISTLLHQAKIEPGFTELVWQKLEEENQEFFRGYHLRLIVKDQIMRFNELLERQVELMSQICPTGIATIPVSNGSQIPSMHHNSVCHAPEHTGAPLKTETIHQNLPTYNNGVSPLQSCMQTTFDMPTHARRIDTATNMLLAQGSNVGITHNMNGRIIKSEAGFAGNTPYMFSTDGTVMDARPVIADGTVQSFSGLESNSHPMNESILDAADNSSFGLLGQMPRSFSLSDLTNSYEIIENYSKCPFLGADPDNFLHPHERGEHQDIKRLDTISEGLSYEGFGSD